LQKLFGLKVAYRKEKSISASGQTMHLAHATETADLRDLPPMKIIFGQTPQMASAREIMKRVAATTVPVLLQGESGTGKDIFARLLHSYSDRSKAAW
jgi:transcriptional regulator with PAS, ATPase and Fis domain